jgi:hypothetical protein
MPLPDTSPRQYTMHVDGSSSPPSVNPSRRSLSWGSWCAPQRQSCRVPCLNSGTLYCLTSFGGYTCRPCWCPSGGASWSLWFLNWLMGLRCGYLSRGLLSGFRSRGKCKGLYGDGVGGQNRELFRLDVLENGVPSSGANFISGNIKCRSWEAHQKSPPPVHLIDQEGTNGLFCPLGQSS